jgi:hypothetical protein
MPMFTKEFDFNIESMPKMLSKLFVVKLKMRLKNGSWPNVYTVRV